MVEQAAGGCTARAPTQACKEEHAGFELRCSFISAALCAQYPFLCFFENAHTQGIPALMLCSHTRGSTHKTLMEMDIKLPCRQGSTFSCRRAAQ